MPDGTQFSAVSVLEAEMKRQLLYFDQQQEGIARLREQIAEAEEIAACHKSRAAACQLGLDVLGGLEDDIRAAVDFASAERAKQASQLPV